MNSDTFLARRHLIPLLFLLAASSGAHAGIMTVGGGAVTILTTAGSIFDNTKGSGTVTGVPRTTQGTLGQFDKTLGVLTSAVATATPNPLVALVKTGGTGSANAYSNWSLGGNSFGGAAINTMNTAQGTDFTWAPSKVISSAANLNNFVGTGNIGANSFSSYLTVNWASGTVAAAAFTGTSLTQKADLVSSESIDYTYSAHSNASFSSGINTDSLIINFGELASNINANQDFNIYDLFGGLGLTSFTSSFLSGNDVFKVAGGSSIGAGSSGVYNAQFLSQIPSANYSGTYRLTFTDDIRGLSQYASDSVGTNYIDLTMNASVATPIPEPQSSHLMILGVGLIGIFIRHRTKA